MELTFHLDAIADLSPDQVKEVKKLYRIRTGGVLVYFADHMIVRAFFGKRLVGFYCVSIGGPGGRFDSDFPYIYNFVVSAKYSKHKPAYMMMKHAKANMEAFSPDATGLVLDVRMDDDHALNFYCRNGFVQIDEWREHRVMKWSKLKIE
jgi:ribosomal protein S18 acetylase RimI-like enzyme